MKENTETDAEFAKLLKEAKKDADEEIKKNLKEGYLSKYGSLLKQ
jgi:hypothetical protein